MSLSTTSHADSERDAKVACAKELSACIRAGRRNEALWERHVRCAKELKVCRAGSGVAPTKHAAEPAKPSTSAKFPLIDAMPDPAQRGQAKVDDDADDIGDLEPSSKSGLSKNKTTEGVRQKNEDFYPMPPLAGHYVVRLDSSGAPHLGRQWGRLPMISLLRSVSTEWAKRHPNQRFALGDISEEGGGKLPDHASHQKGLDVDIYVMRNDNAPLVLQFKGNKLIRQNFSAVGDKVYDKKLTLELLKLFADKAHEAGISIDRVFFNDEGAQSTVPGILVQNDGQAGTAREGMHIDHFHLRLDFCTYFNKVVSPKFKCDPPKPRGN